MFTFLYNSKTLKTLAAWATIMSSAAIGCTPITPDQPYPDEEQEIAGKTPFVYGFWSDSEIVAAGSSIFVYDAVHNIPTTVTFEASNADEVEIQLEPGLDVKSELMKLEDGKWKIDLSEATGMEEGKIYHITVSARNEYGTYDYDIQVEKAYLNSPFEDESYDVPTGGSQYFFYPEGNVKYEWVVSEADGSEGMCELYESIASWSFTVTRNTSLEAREVILTLKDKKGVFEHSATFTQLARDMGEDEILAKERAAMLALYEAFGGSETFHPSSNWGSDAPLSEWGGVQVNSKGYVTNIVANNIKGYLPEEIGDLKYCWEFHAGGKLTGELPKRIGEMTNLKELLIMCDEGYALEGQLSESTLSNIASNLRYIRLPHHNFTGPCPEWLGDTPSNCAFWINGNRLEGKVPDKVKNHKWWTSPNLTGSPEKTYGEFQLQQQEGYILYE